MFGTKPLIAQYEARIKDLQGMLERIGAVYTAELSRKDAEIAELRAQLKPVDTGLVIPFSHYEADQAISGREEVTEDLSPEELREREEEISERDRILSGTY